MSFTAPQIELARKPDLKLNQFNNFGKKGLLFAVARFCPCWYFLCLKKVKMVEMDSYSLVMGLADVQVLTNNFLTLTENIVFTR